MNLVPVSILQGKYVIDIKMTNDQIYFKTSDNHHYLMYHQNNCCENVSIDEIIGDLFNIKGHAIFLAEESTNRDNPKFEHDESFTWTFYRIRTLLDDITIRWYGESNGYYSEDVSFVELTEDEVKEI